MRTYGEVARSRQLDGSSWRLASLMDIYGQVETCSQENTSGINWLQRACIVLITVFLCVNLISSYDYKLYPKFTYLTRIKTSGPIQIDMHMTLHFNTCSKFKFVMLLIYLSLRFMLLLKQDKYPSNLIIRV